MNHRSTIRFTSAICVGLLMLAWFVSTNRCPLAMSIGTLEGMAEQAQCCGQHSPFQGEEAPGAPLQCCKKLDVAPAAPDEKLVRAASFDELGALTHALAFCLQQIPADDREFDRTMGPPGARSFAEIVLQRSLLSHAPPVVV